MIDVKFPSKFCIAPRTTNLSSFARFLWLAWQIAPGGLLARGLCPCRRRASCSARKADSRRSRPLPISSSAGAAIVARHWCSPGPARGQRPQCLRCRCPTLGGSPNRGRRPQVSYLRETASVAWRSSPGPGCSLLSFARGAPKVFYGNCPRR